MLLKRLEIKGFKSFAEKTTIHFKEGITAIVGPNGCGKSNIIDAIRWVLGEQKSSALRTDKMQNVIFNGSTQKKALHLAEVSMVLENNKNLVPLDYHEIEIQRKVYRQGESEYYLNKIPCRLKDIEQLFVHSGIGSDSYSIIELSKIEQILNNKNQERIALFEKVAETAKFKKSKKETIQKLELIQRDLSRIHDLIFEIQSSIKEVREQARRTEIFIKLKEEYKHALTLYLIKKHAEQIEKKKEVLEKQEEEQKEFVLHLHHTRNLEKKIDKLNEAFEEQKNILQETSKEKEEKNIEIKNREKEVALLEERTKNILYQKKEIEKQSQQYQIEVRQYFDEVEKLKKAEKEGEKTLDQYQKSIISLEEQQRRQQKITKELQKKLEEKNNSIHQKKLKYLTEKNKKEFLEKQLQEIRNEQENIHQYIKKKEKEIEKYKQAYPILKKEEEEVKKEKQEIIEKIKISQAREEKQKTEIEKQKTFLIQEKRGFDALKNEYKLLISMQQKMEDYSKTVQYLSTLPFSYILLSNIVSVREGYEMAMELFLNPYLECYIVEKKEEALQMISFLEKEKKGKVQIFILETMAEPKPKKTTSHGIAAIEVIHFEEKYRNLFEYLLEDVFIFETVEEALQEKNIHAISKDGKIVKRKYSITGGGINLFEGKKIGRTHRISYLHEQISKKEEKIHVVEKKITQIEDDYKQEQRKRKSLEDLKNSMERKERETQNRMVEVKTSLTTYDDKHKDMSKSQEELKRKENQVCENIETTQKQIQAYHQEVKQWEEEKENTRNSCNKAEDTLKKYEKSIEEEKIPFLQLEVNHGNTKKTLERYLQTIEKKKEIIEKTSDQLKQLHLKKEVIDKECVKNREELVALLKSKEEIHKKLQKIETYFYQKKETLHSSEQEIRQFQQKKERHFTIINTYREHISQMELEIKTIEERVKIELELEIDHLYKQSQVQQWENLHISSSERKIEKMKEKMKAMGNINYRAIETYQEIKKRIEFMETQKIDLEKAQKTLLETIDIVEKQANAKFIDTLEAINKNFLEVFRYLFSAEDSCQVILSNPSNPMNSEIHIIARPKGKKPTSIQQLSSGEKILTAIALLFSIYLLKPAPFCIFDEVDAPLDDQNIEKFIRIIKNYSKNSQFIIVTHNKNTMSHIDLIYGVTMVEKGVSLVLPINISKKIDN